MAAVAGPCSIAAPNRSLYLYLAANQIGDGRPAASIWAVPSPAEAKFILPGCALASATNSQRLLAATEMHDESERASRQQRDRSEVIFRRLNSTYRAVYRRLINR
jgi:hypothetical protein